MREQLRPCHPGHYPEKSRPELAHLRPQLHGLYSRARA